MHMVENILILGGAGFIGSNTANALVKEGHIVKIIDKLDKRIHEDLSLVKLLDPSIDIIIGNVENAELLLDYVQWATVVYFFPSETGTGESMYKFGKYINGNLGIVASFLSCLGEINNHNIKRVILSSSRAVYGEGPYLENDTSMELSDINIDRAMGRFALPSGVVADKVCEDYRSLPTSIYGLTKKHQEDYMIMASNLLGFELVIYRYFNVYGGDQALNNPYTGVLAFWYRQLRAGKSIELFEEGLPIRDFVHVSDVVQCNILALRIRPDTYNIGTGVGVTLKDLSEALVEAMGLTDSAKVVPTKKYRLGDIYSCIADNSKIVGATGIRFGGLQMGMKEMVSKWDTKVPSKVFVSEDSKVIKEA